MVIPHTHITSFFVIIFRISIEFDFYWSNILMWRLVRGNILGFSGMFKDSHVWLQITLGNQMLREFGFLL